MRRSAGRGQGITEYGLILALVSILAILGLVILGPSVASLMTDLSGSM